MIDPKKLTPGARFTIVYEGLDYFHDCIVVRAIERGKLVEYLNVTSGNIDSCDLKWLTENANPSRKQPWLVSVEKGLGRNDFNVVLASDRRGRQVIIAAGCRFFKEVEHAVAHWKERDRGWLSARSNKRINEHRLDLMAKFKRTLKRRQAA